MKRKRHGNIVSVSVSELNQNRGFGRTLHGTMVWLLLISIFGISSGSVRPVYRLLVLPSDRVPPKHLNVSDFHTLTKRDGAQINGRSLNSFLTRLRRATAATTLPLETGSDSSSSVSVSENSGEEANVIAKLIENVMQEVAGDGR